MDLQSDGLMIELRTVTQRRADRYSPGFSGPLASSRPLIAHQR